MDNSTPMVVESLPAYRKMKDGREKGGYPCPKCPTVAPDEMVLSHHLMTEHRVKLIVTNGGSLSSEPEQDPTPKTAPTSTSNGKSVKCPVCRQHVDDLTYHFATDHQGPVSNDVSNGLINNNVMMFQNNGVNKRKRGANDEYKLLPVFLSNQPLPFGQGEDVSMSRRSTSPASHAAISILSSMAGSHHQQRQGGQAKGGASSNGYGLSTKVDDGGAINLCVKREENLSLNGSVSSPSMSDTNGVGEDDELSSSESSRMKRRRKQTSVPEEHKDQKYWARRLKNNEAAKRSRDMRIKREKVIFDENVRLESENKELISGIERLSTENKELQLKMEFILEENARLQEIIKDLNQQQSSSAAEEETKPVVEMDLSAKSDAGAKNSTKDVTDHHESDGDDVKHEGRDGGNVLVAEQSGSNGIYQEMLTKNL